MNTIETKYKLAQPVVIARANLQFEVLVIVGIHRDIDGVSYTLVSVDQYNTLARYYDVRKQSRIAPYEPTFIDVREIQNEGEVFRECDVYLDVEEVKEKYLRKTSFIAYEIKEALSNMYVSENNIL